MPCVACTYLSNNVPMARTAPQAKNSTISAVSTTFASNRFIIEPPQTGAATGITTDLADQSLPAHLHGLISNSAARKANARSATPVRNAVSPDFIGLYS